MSLHEPPFRKQADRCGYVALVGVLGVAARGHVDAGGRLGRTVEGVVLDGQAVDLDAARVDDADTAACPPVLVRVGVGGLHRAEVEGGGRARRRRDLQQGGRGLAPHVQRASKVPERQTTWSAVIVFSLVAIQAFTCAEVAPRAEEKVTVHETAERRGHRSGSPGWGSSPSPSAGAWSSGSIGKSLAVTGGFGWVIVVRETCPPDGDASPVPSQTTAAIMTTSTTVPPDCRGDRRPGRFTGCPVCPVGPEQGRRRCRKDARPGPRRRVEVLLDRRSGRRADDPRARGPVRAEPEGPRRQRP